MLPAPIDAVAELRPTPTPGNEKWTPRARPRARRRSPPAEPAPGIWPPWTSRRCRADAGSTDVGEGGAGDGGGRQASGPERVGRRVDAESPEAVFTEHDRHATEGVGADEHQLGPAEQKRHRPSPALPQVGVEAAGLREHPGEAGKREGAAERDDAAEGPDGEHRHWIGQQPGDSGRSPEDTRPDRDADDEPDRAPEAERSGECRLQARSPFDPRTARKPSTTNSASTASWAMANGGSDCVGASAFSAGTLRKACTTSTKQLK